MSGEPVFYAHVGIGIVAAIALTFATTLGLDVCVAIGVATVVVLSACLLHRVTVWFAALLGTAMAASYVAAIGYVVGHAGRTPWLPPTAAAIGAIVGGGLAARAYATFIRRARAHRV